MKKKQTTIKDIDDLRWLCKKLNISLKEKVYDDDCCLSYAGWHEDGFLEIRFSTDYEGKQNVVNAALFVLEKLGKITIKDYKEILYEPRNYIQTGSLFQYAIIEFNEAVA
jgi:hypothetical protein